MDHRRTNKCVESLQLNAQRLKDYKARLIIFPRKSGVIKNGDSSREELASATQLKGDILPSTTSESAVSYAPITEEMKAFRARSTLRIARNEAKLAGKRAKAAKEKANKDN